MDTASLNERKSARPFCVVFADAFSFSSYTNDVKTIDGFDLLKLEPGVGYSSNLHYQLFQGRTPDEVGFFTDYSLENDGCERSVSRVHRLMDTFPAINEIYRYARKKGTGRTDNIPFSELRCFENKGSYLFMEDGPCNVFGQEVCKCYERSIDGSFDKALQNISADHIVVVLEDLDEIGHACGCRSREYATAASRIMDKTKRLFKEFSQHHEDAFLLLVSDHGMAYVLSGLDVMMPLRNRFGDAGPRYQYLCDSVYLRVWSKDEDLLSEIRAYLDGISVLNRLSSETRDRFGVTNRKFGDEIYCLSEGYGFSPNCFGLILKTLVRGMHGYMDASDDASGIVVSSEPLNYGVNGGLISARDLFKSVCDCVYR